MRLSRRGWNNVLMVGVILFMIILNLPTIIKENFLSQDETQYPALFEPGYTVQKMHFARWSLTHNEQGWQSDRTLSVSPLEAMQHWKSLNGTPVDENTFKQLKPQLTTPSTLEVWYVDKEEPQRITFYQMPRFWLMQNWQQQWIAVSVEREYLFPFL